MQNIKEELLLKLKEVKNLSDLNDVRVLFLGKKGKIQ